VTTAVESVTVMICGAVVLACGGPGASDGAVRPVVSPAEARPTAAPRIDVGAVFVDLDDRAHPPAMELVQCDGVEVGLSIQLQPAPGAARAVIHLGAHRTEHDCAERDDPPFTIRYACPADHPELHVAVTGEEGHTRIELDGAAGGQPISWDTWASVAGRPGQPARCAVFPALDASVRDHLRELALLTCPVADAELSVVTDGGHAAVSALIHGDGDVKRFRPIRCKPTGDGYRCAGRLRGGYGDLDLDVRLSQLDHGGWDAITADGTTTPCMSWGQ
jgi:hypothetical protein